MHFRVGVNLGDVVVKNDDLLGDGVNVAARSGCCEAAHRSRSCRGAHPKRSGGGGARGPVRRCQVGAGATGVRSERGTEGTADFFRIQGDIHPDGAARLDATGITGDPKFLLKGGRSGVPYTYTVVARFDNSRGTGRRQQLGSCLITFARQ